MSSLLNQIEHFVTQTSVELFLFVLLLLSLFAIVCWYKTFRSISHGRLIENVPTSKVRSAAQGYVELIGYSELMEGLPIIAPLSGRKCVWYRYRIEKKQRLNRNNYWQVIEKGISDGLFLLKDDTGHCVIDPEKARVTGTNTKSWRGSHRRPLGMPSKTSIINRWFSLGSYRYTESRLEEYESLYAIGDFRTVGRGENLSDIKNDVRDLIAKWKHDPGQLKKFDANQDGEIDMAEWEQLRQAAHQEVLKNQVKHSAAPAVHMMQNPKDGRPYLLSTRDPMKMVQYYRWTAAALLFMAIFLSALTLYMINLRLTV